MKKKFTACSFLLLLVVITLSFNVIPSKAADTKDTKEIELTLDWSYDNVFIVPEGKTAADVTKCIDDIGIKFNGKDVLGDMGKYYWTDMAICYTPAKDSNEPPKPVPENEALKADGSYIAQINIGHLFFAPEDVVPNYHFPLDGNRYTGTVILNGYKFGGFNPTSGDRELLLIDIPLKVTKDGQKLESSLKLKKSSFTVKANKLKTSKNSKVSIADLKIDSDNFTVKLVKDKGNSKSVNVSKTGGISIKKNAAKGKHTVKVKITTPESMFYKSGSAVKTLTITVK